jgi:hypothetical protein
MYPPFALGSRPVKSTAAVRDPRHQGTGFQCRKTIRRCGSSLRASVRRGRCARYAQNVCFLSEILATAGGFTALTRMLRGKRGWRFAKLGLCASLAAAGAGVLYMSLMLAERQTDMPPMYSGVRANPLHAAFGVMTLLGLVCYGLAFVRLGRLKWTGVISILLSGLMLVEVMHHGDAFPPLFSTLYRSFSRSSVPAIELLFLPVDKTVKGDQAVVLFAKLMPVILKVMPITSSQRVQVSASSVDTRKQLLASLRIAGDVN